MAENLKLRNKRKTQLNEKVSTTQYDVLYPETIAEQVITNDNRMFVTKAQIDSWNSGKGSVHFRGEWNAGSEYAAGDIVLYKDFYFICDRSHTALTSLKPQPDLPTSIYGGSVIYWYNIDYYSQIASKANTVQTQLSNADKKYFLTFVDNNNSDADPDYEKVYTNSGISYDPATQTLTVKRLEGTADKALVAEEANHAKEADHATKADTSAFADTADNYKNGAGKTNIKTTIDGINKRLDDITSGGGGAVLSNKLFIEKNGSKLNPDGFNGSTEQTVNITIAPADVIGLLNTVNKIDNKWLPDSILGNLRYCGTVNESGVITSNDSDFNGKNISTISALNNPGIYFLASFTDPKLSAKLVDIEDVRQGDWIVSNGKAGWIKVDNTDAVTMVNGQTGAVETYKKEWKTNTTYFTGDIILYGGALYVVNQKHNSNTKFNPIYYDIFGRLYQAADGIKLEGSTFKHDVIVKPGTSESVQLLYGDTFDVPSYTTDKWGHLTHTHIYNYKLPPITIDTWRPVNVNGTEILAKDNTTNPLTFVDNDMISFRYAENILNIEHAKTGYDASSFVGKVVEPIEAGEDKLNLGNGFTVPEFEYDAYGHIKNVHSLTYRLPNAAAVISHKHFEVKDVNGVATIGMYEKADTPWVDAKLNGGKFYAGEVVPRQSTRMNYNGTFAARSLYQNSNGVLRKVLDAGITVVSGKKINGVTDIVSMFNDNKNEITLGDSGVLSGTYSAVAVNSKGIVTYGGAILEFGHLSGSSETNEPSAALAVGGLFFRQMA